MARAEPRRGPAWSVSVRAGQWRGPGPLASAASRDARSGSPAWATALARPVGGDAPVRRGRRWPAPGPRLAKPGRCGPGPAGQGDRAGQAGERCAWRPGWCWRGPCGPRRRPRLGRRWPPRQRVPDAWWAVWVMARASASARSAVAGLGSRPRWRPRRRPRHRLEVRVGGGVGQGLGAVRVADLHDRAGQPSSAWERVGGGAGQGLGVGGQPGRAVRVARLGGRAGHARLGG